MISKLLLASASPLVSQPAPLRNLWRWLGRSERDIVFRHDRLRQHGFRMTGSGSTGSGAIRHVGSVSGGATSSGGTSSGTQRTTGDDCINASPNQNQRDANPSASAPTACN